MLSWFGRSKDALWQDLADELGGTFEPDSWTRPARIEVERGGWLVTLDTRPSGPERSARDSFLQMGAPYRSQDGLQFSVRPEGPIFRLGKMLGFQDIQVGDKAVDDAFLIRGNDEAQIKRLFQSASFKGQLMAASNWSFTFRVVPGNGWFGPKLPPDTDMLQFDQVSGAFDIGQLRRLFDLFAVTLDQLCRISAAYEPAPNFDG